MLCGTILLHGECTYFESLEYERCDRTAALIDRHIEINVDNKTDICIYTKYLHIFSLTSATKEVLLHHSGRTRKHGLVSTSISERSSAEEVSDMAYLILATPFVLMDTILNVI